MAKTPQTKKEFFKDRHKKIHIQNETLKQHSEQQQKAIISQGGNSAAAPASDPTNWQSKITSMAGSIGKNRSKLRKRSKGVFR